MIGSKIKVGGCYKAIAQGKPKIVKVLAISEPAEIRMTENAGRPGAKTHVSRPKFVSWVMRDVIPGSKWTKTPQRTRLRDFAMKVTGEVACD